MSKPLVFNIVVIGIRLVGDDIRIISYLQLAHRRYGLWPKVNWRKKKKKNQTSLSVLFLFFFF